MMATTCLPPHIVVLVHGNNGAPSDFDAVEKTLQHKYSTSEMMILKSAANHTQTALGVEIGGAKLAAEIVEAVLHYDRSPDVASYKLSIIAHSLGGLFARFALPTVQDELSSLPFEYVSFITLCTPHLGVRKPHAQSVWKNIFRCGVHTVLESNTIFGQTGFDLMIMNDPEDESISKDKVPVIEAISAPDSTYVRALQRFRHCTLVAVTDGDLSVPFPSGSLRNFNPYKTATLTKHHEEWRWHLRHHGFAKGNNIQHDAASAAMLKRLNDHVDQRRKVKREQNGLDATKSKRFASIDGYDCDNRRELEFPFELLVTQQAMVDWRRIDILIDVGGVAGKLRLHDWPINKMQPSDCLAPEFIDVLGDLVGNDHGLGLRDSALTAPASDDETVSA